VAVRLPDFTSLAGVETGARNVPPGDIRPTYLGADPEAEALAQRGASLGALGAGLEKTGTGLAAWASHADMVNQALARAQFHTDNERIVADAAAETDPAKLDAHYSRLQAGWESASQLIQDPGRREAWKATHMPELVAAQIKIEKRQHAVYDDRFLAGVDQQDKDLQLRAESPDPEVRKQAINDRATLYSSMAEAGVISRHKAVELADVAHKRAILGYSLAEDARGNPAAAEANLRANAATMPAEVLDRYLPHFESRRRKLRGEDLGRTVATGGRTDFSGAQPSQPSASANLENFNFGNMKAVGGGWRTFGSEEEGAQAIGDWLVRHNQSGQATIRQLIDDPHRGYAPSSDQGNAGKNLPEAAAKIVGVGPDTPVDMSDPALRRKMVGAIVQQEFGNPKITQRVLSAYDRAPSKPAMGGETVPAAAEGGFAGLTTGELAGLGVPAAAAGAPARPAGPPTLQEQFDTIDATPGYDEEEKQHAKMRAQQIDSQRRVAMRGEIATVKKLMGDDLASLEQTGKQIPELTYDRVRASYGPEVADNWQQEREFAQNFYDKTSDFDRLPNYELDRRLEQIRTEGAGQPGFLQRQRVYAQADKKAKALEELRSKFPADAVAHFPEVMAAAQGANLSNPISYRPLVEARIRAMVETDQPLDAQIPITQREARTLYRPIEEALRLGDQALLRERVRQVVQTVDQGWGGYAPAAMSMIMGVGHANEQVKETLHSVMRKLGNGLPPTSQEGRILDEAANTGAAGSAVAGLVPTAAAAPRSYPVPDAGAIQLLRQSPQDAPAYDATYGPGAAARVLGATPPAAASAPAATSPTETPQPPPPPERVYRSPDAAAIEALRRRPLSRPGFEATYGPGSADKYLPPPAPQ
jgi:hypothetical protein